MDPCKNLSYDSYLSKPFDNLKDSEPGFATDDYIKLKLVQMQ